MILHLAGKAADESADIDTGADTGINANAGINASDHFVWLVGVYRTAFTCATCREHFNAYCAKNPPPSRASRYGRDGRGRRESAFEWTWKAHNNANLLTNKPLVELDVVRRWYDTNARSGGCHSCTAPQSTEEEGKNLGYMIRSTHER
jgi:hypothetical protein